MTRPPAASIRAAAAMTSITMNGGTSLRRTRHDGAGGIEHHEAVSRRSGGAPKACPAVAAFDRSLQACVEGSAQPERDLGCLTLLGAATRLAEHLGSGPHGHDEAGSTIRVRRRTPAARALALLTAFAIATVPTTAVAPTPARAQSLPPGLPVIRDAESSSCCASYTQPILRAAASRNRTSRSPSSTIARSTLSWSTPSASSSTPAR